METTGKITKINAEQKAGINTKQRVELLQDNQQVIELLLFNNLDKIRGIQEGERVKVLFNPKDKIINGQTVTTNYINHVQKVTEQSAEQSGKVIYSRYEPNELNHIQQKDLYAKKIYDATCEEYVQRGGKYLQVSLFLSNTLHNWIYTSVEDLEQKADELINIIQTTDPTINPLKAPKLNYSFG